MNTYDRPINIGYIPTEARLEARTRNLQAGNPSELRLLATAPGSFGDYESFTKMVADDHIRGNWYFPSDEITETIDLLLQCPVLNATDWLTEVRFRIKLGPYDKNKSSGRRRELMEKIERLTELYKRSLDA